MMAASGRLAQTGLSLLLRSVTSRTATERRLIGLSLLRVSAAGVMLIYLLGQWPERHLIWGPDGTFPTWIFERDLPVARAPSLFATGSPLVFDLLYHLTIGVAVCYLLGWKSVPVGMVFAVLTWSLLRRHPFVMTGGDSLLLLSLPWLMLTNTSAYFSIDSGWRTVRSEWRPTPRPWRALLHNVGVLGLLLQLATMYLVAGLHKLFGAPWLDGSAAGIVLRIDRFSLPALSPLVYENELVSQAMTYWTVLFELTAPVLLWLPATRWLVAVQSVLFHGGIGILMGLVIFALEATMFQLIVFPDSSYRRLAARIGRSRAPTHGRSVVGADRTPCTIPGDPRRV
jgi:HTTM domain